VRGVDKGVFKSTCYLPLFALFIGIAKMGKNFNPVDAHSKSLESWDGAGIGGES
jgi:hypothetical protein